MNVYLFSAGVTVSQGKAFGSHSLRTWDECIDLIVAGDNPQNAQQRFESWLQTAAKDGMQMDLGKIVAAQFLQERLAESGSTEIDWPRLCQEAEARLAATSVDDSEQGYWVDVNEFIRPGQTVANVEALQRELPEDLRSGLNWSPEKTFLFVVSILSPSSDRAGTSDTPTMYEEAENQDSNGAGEANLDEPLVSLPELVAKAAAVVVEARNSIVAAWLWQKFAAATPLAGNRIQISPWCRAIGFEKE